MFGEQSVSLQFQDIRMKKNNPSTVGPNGSRFYICSFQNSVVSFMSPTMAIQMYVLIESMVDVSKELFAFKEKLRTQLFHLNKTKELDDALRSFNLGTTEGEPGTPIAVGVSPIGDGSLVDVLGGVGG
jgi:hypothetical protein